MEKKSGKLEGLQRKQEQLKARIQLMKALERTRERKRDTRRKILIGAYYHDRAVREERFHEIVKIMDGYLSRDSDRALFGLSPAGKKR